MSINMCVDKKRPDKAEDSRGNLQLYTVLFALSCLTSASEYKQTYNCTSNHVATGQVWTQRDEQHKKTSERLSVTLACDEDFNGLTLGKPPARCVHKKRKDTNRGKRLLLLGNAGMSLHSLSERLLSSETTLYG